MIGMMDWKNPNDAPTLRAKLGFFSFIVRPLVIATEKQSIANPTATSRISVMSNEHHWFTATLFRHTTYKTHIRMPKTRSPIKNIGAY
jgi:hypothetical protein